ncbi:hypothetical protein PR048_009362 [Dryococelus australis]|uniref:Uncharacterized protein n=1 Tax=Dryococelus australis TaxID=614101 RepID=A0ABQ9HZN5_9NEOP|nr:hypothetical protein PR048_009362 [Dryococelus australis]
MPDHAGMAQGNVQPLLSPVAAAEADKFSQVEEPEESSSTGEVQKGIEPIPSLNQDEGATPDRSAEPQRQELPPHVCRTNFQNKEAGTRTPCVGLPVNLLALTPNT